MRWRRESLRADDELEGTATQILPRPRPIPEQGFGDDESTQALPWPGVFAEARHQGLHETQALDPIGGFGPAGRPDPFGPTDPVGGYDEVAGATADPFLATTVVSRPGGSAPQSPPQLDRHRAAELGMYVGAAIVTVAVLGLVMRQWAGWTGEMRLGTTLLASVALICGGLFLRLPWHRPMTAERRRAVSAVLGLGVGAAAVGLALCLDIRQSSDPVAAIGHALLAVAGLAAVCFVAGTAFTETLLLGALCWLAWVGLPAGTALHAGLAAVGVAWVLAGRRWARGPRTSAVAGTMVALVGGTLLASEPGAWVARGALVLIAGGALWAFLTGRSVAWLALAAGAACAAAAGTGADLLSPAPALLAGGLATMAVCGAALRGVRLQTPPDDFPQTRPDALDTWAI